MYHGSSGDCHAESMQRLVGFARAGQLHLAGDLPAASRSPREAPAPMRTRCGATSAASATRRVKTPTRAAWVVVRVHLAIIADPLSPSLRRARTPNRCAASRRSSVPPVKTYSLSIVPMTPWLRYCMLDRQSHSVDPLIRTSQHRAHHPEPTFRQGRTINRAITNYLIGA